MSAFHDNALIGASGQQGYNISRSVRYRASASPYFTRPFATPTNSSKWTMSMWVKRGVLSSATTPALFGKTISASANFYLAFDPANTMTWTFSNTAYMTTTQVFRDPSAWYHIVAVWDSANATAAQRARLYVNGTEVTAFSVDNRSSITTSMDAWNTTSTAYLHGLGCASATVSTVTQFFDGYLTEVNFIDGQALTPSSFGENDTITGVWKPKKYAGTYGTNGFYLNFSDNSGATAATIGKDYSGNGNNWTPNNISVTSGSTYDSMIDVPTPYADGGNGRGNYAVLNVNNQLVVAGSGGSVITQGNLLSTGPASANSGSFYPSTIAASSGKWYAELNLITVGTANSNFGIVPSSLGRTWSSSVSVLVAVYNSTSSNISKNGSVVQSSLTAWANGDVCGIAVDLDNGTVQYYRNGSAYGSQVTGITAVEYCIGIYTSQDSLSSISSAAINFGQRPFAYTPPSGFKALNTQNLPSSTISNGANYMNVALWSGASTGTQIDVTSYAFQPDLIWSKTRNNAYDHYLQDAVRGIGVGATNTLSSNLTSAEANTSGLATAFLSNGFRIGSSALSTSAGNSLVTWGWKESATAGFDIVTYTGNGSNRTIAHSLGVAPKMLVVKARNLPNSIARPWAVWHTALSSTEVIFLNDTAAKSTGATTYWNSTLPTSSVFSVGTEPVVNGATGTVGEYVAYLFSEVAGFSKFGSYTGNGSSDGPFVHLGFRARYLLIKETGNANSWEVYDTARNVANVQTQRLFPNDSLAEATTDPSLDILSNGFKCRAGNTGINRSGGTYIYAAFAENPFKNALAR